MSWNHFFKVKILVIKETLVGAISKGLMSYLRKKQMTIDFFHFTFVSMKKMEIWTVDTFLNDIFLNYTWLIREKI